MKTTIYYYDPCTNLYLGQAQVNEAEQQLIAPAFTVTPVLEAREGKLIIYDPQNGNWYYIAKYCYQIDAKGFVTAKYENPLPSSFVSDNLIDAAPDPGLQNPRWNGTGWEDKPVPAELFIPVFDLQTSAWKEGAAPEVIRKRIDARTNQLISKWCSDQTKCEEYYLNKGIENNTDPEYLAYKAARAQIIQERRQTKVDAGVY